MCMLPDFNSQREVWGSNPAMGILFFLFILYLVYLTAHRKMVGSNLKGSLHSDGILLQ